MKFPKIVILIISFISSFDLFSCVWDYDTNRYIGRELPDTMYIISGNFKRHSKEFYNWRISDRTVKLNIGYNNQEFIDDLIVAYDKVGNNRMALKIAIEQVRKNPNRFITLANLGNVYINSGNYKEGLRYLKRAIEVNPNPVFDRELYQIYLMEYLLDNNEIDSFALYLKLKYTEKGIVYSIEENNRAIKALSAMIYFGNYNSPILLKSLGDLLIESGEKILGINSYLMAEKYSMSRDNSLLSLESTNLNSLELKEIRDKLEIKVSRGVKLVDEVETDQKKLLEYGLNPETE